MGTLNTGRDLENGAKQITYNGGPLYTFKGAKALTTNGNGVGGVWRVVRDIPRATSSAALAEHHAPEVPAFPGHTS